MNVLRALTVYFLVFPGAAIAQIGGVVISPNSQGWECQFFEGIGQSPKVYSLYVVHFTTPGARAVRFRIAPGGGFEGILLEDNSSFVHAGDAQTGMTVCYNSCLGPPSVVAATVTYFSTADSPTCSYLDVAAHPGAPTGLVEIIDCDDTLIPVVGGRLWVNPDPSCNCFIDPFGPEPPEAPSALDNFTPCTPLSVDRTSWGAIKALFHP